MEASPEGMPKARLAVSNPVTPGCWTIIHGTPPEIGGRGLVGNTGTAVGAAQGIRSVCCVPPLSTRGTQPR